MKKVVILEDELILAKLYQKKLTSAGYDVQTVENVDSAINVVKEYKPDLILVDHGIRGKDKSGLDFIVEVKKISPDVVAVMLTNYSHNKLKDEVTKAGAADFLIKLNTSPQILVEYVDKLFEKVK